MSGGHTVNGGHTVYGEQEDVKIYPGRWDELCWVLITPWRELCNDGQSRGNCEFQLVQFPKETTQRVLQNTPQSTDTRWSKLGCHYHLSVSMGGHQSVWIWGNRWAESFRNGEHTDIDMVRVSEPKKLWISFRGQYYYCWCAVIYQFVQQEDWL